MLVGGEHPQQEQQNIRIPLLTMPYADPIHPRNQTYYDMLKQSLCPYYTLRSFTTIFMLILLIMFIIPLALRGYYSGSLLQISNFQAIANIAQNVHQGQVYRLFSSLFIHANLLSILISLLILLYVMPAIEYSFGWIRAVIVFLLSGMAGNLFYNVWANQYQSKFQIYGSVLGTLGMAFSLLFYVIVNYSGIKLMQNDGSLIFRFYMNLGFMLFFVIFISITLPGTNTLARLGAAINGLLLGSIYPTILKQSFQVWSRRICFILFLIWQLVVILVFYLAK